MLIGLYNGLMSAFIKRYKAKNGATVIQVVFKHGRQVVKTVHIGTAHNDIQEAELRSVASETILAGQLTMDIFGDDPDGLDMLTEKTYSSLLWDTMSEVYDSLGFDCICDEVFKQLVLARIIEPTSKFDSIRVIANLGLKPPTNAQIHRTLNRVVERDYRGQLSTECLKRTAPFALTLLLYDVTTLYFEVQKEDDFRKGGMSKERRLEPQITLGLLTGRDGFPLEIMSFEGNRAEVKTIMEVLGAFQMRHGLDEMTITADAAMLSSKNIQELEDAGYHYIIGSRIAKTPWEIAEYAKEPGAELEDGQVFDLYTDMNTGKAQKRIGRRVIYQYKAKRAKMDLLNIDKLLDKAKKMLDGKAEYRRNRFLKVKGQTKEINYELVEQSRLKAGIKGYVTDLDIAAQEVIDAYHQLFEIERSFRMSKSDLKARPIFHHKRDSIEAHLTVVFAALAISRVIQARTGLSIKRFKNTLEPIRTSVVRIGGKSRAIPPLVPSAVRSIISDLQNR